ncbi:storkhead-box protein 2-like [Mytilus edulis]|uniref:storkhead-box protein 2-like n=1 Tax=Mytilus edulis TaxID=6550 RepID=UPI0039F141F1
MTGKSAGRKENKQIIQQVSPVTSKCLAMVVSLVVEDKAVNGKEIFDDFQLRNSTCYWNSALSDSIKNLQYLGFLEPNTILLGGTDVCLENLRMAWGRRVLNDPHDCRIEKIGDIGNITMQEVPQNHFIPLPEILCLIILDLNNKQILATVDIIQAQLKKCYQGTQLPSNQLVYETLHNLIQERKLFHTGSGYFVVTPDTLRLPVDLPSPSLPPQHNPMYLPFSRNLTMCDRKMSPFAVPMTTVAMTQTLPPVRSISCQVSIANQKRASTPDLKIEETEKSRLHRSHSARRHKDKNHNDAESLKKNVSVRAQDDCLTNKDVNVMKSNLNKVKEKGEKKSLLSKLFGKKKKTDEVKHKCKEQETKDKKCKEPETKDTKKYATFSGQFPPPEWMWYQDQCKKHERTNKWVTQQTGMVQMSHGQISHKIHRPTFEIKKDLHQCNSISPVTLPTAVSSSKQHKSHKQNHKVSPSEKAHTYHEIESFTRKMCNKAKKMQQSHCVQEMPQESRFLPIKESQEKNPDIRVRRSKSHNRKSNRHSVDVGLLRRQHAHRELQQDIQNEQSRVMGEQSRVMGLSPMYSSTPRDVDKRFIQPSGEYVDMCSSPVLREVNRTDHRSHRRRSKHYKRIENDINYEHHGVLPRKHSNIAMSRDSGVNCVGLSNPSENNNVFCYNQLMDYENVKSNNLHKSWEMQGNTQHNGELKKNEIVCIAEINACVPEHSDYVEINSIEMARSVPSEVNEDTKENQPFSNRSDDIGLMDSSEQSYDTVIYNKRVQDVSKETENLTLGDSGFYSPRVTEIELGKNKKVKVPLYKNLSYDHHELNNLKDFQKEKIVLNNEFYKEPSPSSDYQIVGVV